MEQHHGSGSTTYPCCSGAHTTLPAAVIVQLVGFLQLCCGACKRPIELKEIREYVNPGCTVGSLPSSSQQTVNQILSRPLCAPPAATKKKLATAVIKRMLIASTSPTSSSSSSTSSSSSPQDVVSLPTGGQVRKVYVHTHTCDITHVTCICTYIATLLTAQLPPKCTCWRTVCCLFLQKWRVGFWSPWGTECREHTHSFNQLNRVYANIHNRVELLHHITVEHHRKVSPLLKTDE